MTQEQASQAPMSFPARAMAIFSSPSAVFQELSMRPTWLAPLLLVTLIVAAMQVVILNTATGQNAMRQEFQEKIPQNAPPDMVERQLAMTKFAAPIGVLFFVPLVTLFMAGVVYVIFGIVLGGDSTFRQTFSAYCHTGIIGILAVLVQTVMVFLKGSMKSSTALSAFLPFLEEKSFAFKIFQMLDVFIIWQLAVISIGMGLLSRVGTRKAATVIFSVYVVVVIAIAAIRQFLF
jgi:Yip1-like protein